MSFVGARLLLRGYTGWSRLPAFRGGTGLWRSPGVRGHVCLSNAREEDDGKNAKGYASAPEQFAFANGSIGSKFPHVKAAHGRNGTAVRQPESLVPHRAVDATSGKLNEASAEQLRESLGECLRNLVGEDITLPSPSGADVPAWCEDVMCSFFRVLGEREISCVGGALVAAMNAWVKVGVQSDVVVQHFLSQAARYDDLEANFSQFLSGALESDGMAVLLLNALIHEGKNTLVRTALIAMSHARTPKTLWRVVRAAISKGDCDAALNLHRFGLQQQERDTTDASGTKEDQGEALAAVFSALIARGREDEACELVNAYADPGGSFTLEGANGVLMSASMHISSETDRDFFFTIIGRGLLEAREIVRRFEDSVNSDFKVLNDTVHLAAKLFLPPKKVAQLNAWLARTSNSREEETARLLQSLIPSLPTAQLRGQSSHDWLFLRRDARSVSETTSRLLQLLIRNLELSSGNSGVAAVIEFCINRGVFLPDVASCARECGGREVEELVSQWEISNGYNTSKNIWRVIRKQIASGELDKAFKHFVQVRDMGVYFSRSEYNELMSEFVAASGVEQALAVYRVYRVLSGNNPLANVTGAAMLLADMLEQGMESELREILDDFVEKDGSLSGDCELISLTIEELHRRRSTAITLRFFQYLREQYGTEPTDIKGTYAFLVRRQETVAEALSIFNVADREGLSDEPTYNALIEVFCRNQVWLKALGVLDTMEREGMEITEETLYPLFYHASKHRTELLPRLREIAERLEVPLTDRLGYCMVQGFANDEDPWKVARDIVQNKWSRMWLMVPLQSLARQVASNEHRFMQFGQVQRTADIRPWKILLQFCEEFRMSKEDGYAMFLDAWREQDGRWEVTERAIEELEREGLARSPVLLPSLIRMKAHLRGWDAAMQLYESRAELNLAIVHTMIRLATQLGETHSVLDVLQDMYDANIRPRDHTLHFVLVCLSDMPLTVLKNTLRMFARHGVRSVCECDVCIEVRERCDKSDGVV